MASPIAVTPILLVIFGASLSGSTVGVCDNDKRKWYVDIFWNFADNDD